MQNMHAQSRDLVRQLSHEMTYLHVSGYACKSNAARAYLSEKEAVAQPLPPLLHHLRVGPLNFHQP